MRVCVRDACARGHDASPVAAYIVWQRSRARSRSMVIIMMCLRWRHARHTIYIYTCNRHAGAPSSQERENRAQVYSIWCGAVARGGVADFRYFLIAACLSVRNDVHNVHIRNADWGAIFCGGSFNILIGHLCNKCELIRVIYKQSRRRLKMEHISMM